MWDGGGNSSQLMEWKAQDTVVLLFDPIVWDGGGSNSQLMELIAQSTVVYCLTPLCEQHQTWIAVKFRSAMDSLREELPGTPVTVGSHQTWGLWLLLDRDLRSWCWSSDLWLYKTHLNLITRVISWCLFMQGPGEGEFSAELETDVLDARHIGCFYVWPLFSEMGEVLADW